MIAKFQASWLEDGVNDLTNLAATTKPYSVVHETNSCCSFKRGWPRPKHSSLSPHLCRSCQQQR
jgi:hypothetical protein